MNPLGLQAVPAFSGQLPDMPIEPSWILQGTPTARGVVLVQSQDRCVSSGLWECTAGTFQWIFSWDEFVYILEGEMMITEQSGKSYTLHAGDLAHFPRGLATRWDVPNFVRKVFTIRTPEPLAV